MRVTHQGYLDCSQCTQSFSTEKFLLEHKETKHSEKKDLLNKEIFTCNICNRNFSKKKSLTDHNFYYHTNISQNDPGPFVCDHCGKELPGKIALTYHEKKVHNPKQCPTCYKVVKNLRYHTLRNHTENSTLKRKCEHCGKGFVDKNQLKSHEMNVHIKARPFRCRYKCENDIGYNDLSNRNSHEKKKHGGVFSNVSEI